MRKKTAVVLIHGIGEQVPMETLRGFVDTVWTSDPDLVDRGKPDPDTGEARSANASWSKPDERNRSFELQLITTETGKNRKRIEFFEYYWAHRVMGTTLAQVQGWFADLLWRNPLTRVPRGLRLTWVFLWLIVLGIAALWALPYILGSQAQKSLWWTLGSLLVTLIGGVGVKLLISHAGDVAQYVKANPKNIAVRQAIRENGVQLLETLMGVEPDGSLKKTDYDRIILVGHSLGTIIGYDILTHCFGRINDILAKQIPDDTRQPARDALESFIREAESDPAIIWDNARLAEFRAMQAACLKEMQALGNPWIVSDFVTLGSPLTHAEFLMERDWAHLQEAQRQRILPTCPPTLEFDRRTDQKHFSYRHRSLRLIGDNSDPQAPRVPHHAALFAYTRWTNIYSPHWLIGFGDVISGPLASAMGLARKGATTQALSGIRDIAVLPSEEGSSADRRRRFFTHLKYWNRTVAKVDGADREPAHIVALREALDLGET